MDIEERLSERQGSVTKSRIGSWLALLTGFITFVMMLIALSNGQTIQAVVEGASMLVALGAFLLIRLEVNVRWAALAVILTIAANVAFTASAGGGFGSLTVAWLAILVLAGYAVGGRVVGVGSAGVTLAFIAVASTGMLDFEFGTSDRAVDYAIELGLMISVCLGIIWLFESEKESEVERQRAIVAELQSTNADLEAAIEEIRTLQAKLTEAERHGSLQRLAGHFAHDFNNLLTGIMAEVDLAILVSSEEEVCEGLENALHSARKAADLTRSMLTYSGRRTTRYREVSASEILKDATTLGRLSTRHGVDFEIEISDEACVFEGDLSQMEQAILNLILNGVQASDAQRPKIALSATCLELEKPVEGAGGTRCQKGEVVALTVRDFGRGIPTDIGEQILEPYFTTRDDGQGLGLSSVVGIVRGHHGALVMEPADPGTKVRIIMPVKRPLLDEEPVVGSFGM